MANGSLSQFKATLARKIERKQKIQSRSERNSSSYRNSDLKAEYNFPELSESELEKVKSKIRKKIVSDRKREFIVVTIVTVIVILILVSLISSV